MNTKARAKWCAVVFLCVISLALTGCGDGGGGSSSSGGGSGVVTPNDNNIDPDYPGADTGGNGAYAGGGGNPSTLPVAHNPEPATLLLFLTGAAGAAALSKRRKKS